MIKFATRCLALGLVVAAFSSSAMAVTPATPEIDPGSVVSGMTLLGAAMLLLRDKSRRAR